MYAVFNKPVSVVESTVYVTAIFKQHALRILRQYLPLYREADRRGMLAQVEKEGATHLLTLELRLHKKRQRCFFFSVRLEDVFTNCASTQNLLFFCHFICE